MISFSPMKQKVQIVQRFVDSVRRLIEAEKKIAQGESLEEFLYKS